MKSFDECFALVQPGVRCFSFTRAHTLDLVGEIDGRFSQRDRLLVIFVRQSKRHDVAQAEITHRLNRRAGAHETAGLIAKEVIEHGSGAVLEHLHPAEQRARVKVLIAHAAQRRTVVSAPDFQRPARHHAAH